ncbi:alpha/beta hydrolase [Mycolicibacterium sp. CBM1]
MAEFRTVGYTAGADPRQCLDIFASRSDRDLRTAVLVIHGGGFAQGARGAVHARCEALADRGITALAVGYRLLDTAAWPAPVEDVCDALRWVGAHTEELGVDPGRIVLQGHSAGAQLALLVAGGAGGGIPPVGAVVSYYPAARVSLTPGPGEMPAQMLFGEAATAAAADAASVLTYVGGRFPPSLLIHGAGDRLVDPAASLRIFDALVASGVRAELHLAAGQDHEFDMTPRYNRTMTELSVDFLRAELIEPEVAAEEVAAANPFATMPMPGGRPS